MYDKKAVMKYRAKPDYRFKRMNTIWKKYGVFNQDGTTFSNVNYNVAFQVQGGMCAICGKHQSELAQSMVPDHHHETGIFRGLLCHFCNSMVLNVVENFPDSVLKAKHYLEVH